MVHMPLSSTLFVVVLEIFVQGLNKDRTFLCNIHLHVSILLVQVSALERKRAREKEKEREQERDSFYAFPCLTECPFVYVREGFRKQKVYTVYDLLPNQGGGGSGKLNKSKTAIGKGF